VFIPLELCTYVNQSCKRTSQNYFKSENITIFV